MNVRQQPSSLVDDREVRRVRDVVTRRLAETLNADGGAFVQALGIIEVIHESTNAEQLEKVEAWFVKMCGELGVAVDDRAYSPVELVQPTQEPPRDVIENAIESVRRALRDASSSSDATIPVMLERLAMTTTELGAGYAPEVARWIIRRLRRSRSTC